MNDLDPEPRIESRIEPGFDPGFDQLYRAASTEQPGAAADAAILALAHAAAAETRAAAPVSRLRRWRTPLGLAASLVLAVGIVSRVQVEQEAGTAPGSAPAPAPSVPASVPPSVPAPAPVSAPVQASEPSSAPAGGQGRIQAPAVAPPSPAQSGVKPEALEKRKALADSVVTAEDSVRKESVTPARESGDSKRSQPLASAGAGGAANSACAPAAAASAAASSELSAAATASAPAPKPAPAPAQSPQPVPLARAAAPAVVGEAQRDDTMGSRAAVAPQRRPAAAGSTALNEAIEAALTPEQWLRRIIDARRGGRDDEADASLKRFIAHHPAQPVPPEARRAVER